MARHPSVPPGPEAGRRPSLTLVLSGLGLTVATALLAQALPSLLALALVVAGALAVAVGLVWRFRETGWGFDERLSTAGLTFLAAVAAFAGASSMPEDWDSAGLVLGVLSLVALGGAALVLLPTVPRRVVVSLLVLVHFGGILTAITSVPPPNGQAPWLTAQVWGRFYRPYLQLVHLNNAYHFYSPDPGPPNLLWFYIEYEAKDGGERLPVRTVKIPNREDFPTRLAYQRRLALTESTAEVNTAVANSLAPDVMGAWRNKANAQRAERGLVPIKLHPYLPPNLQFQPPAPHSRRMVASYARHVANAPEYRHERYPDVQVKAVKVYRLIHAILTPKEFADDVDPLDPATYRAYFMGEFHPDGTLVDPNDPFLYWLIPIYRDPEDQQFRSLTPGVQKTWPLRNYLDVHAGVKPLP